MIMLALAAAAAPVLGTVAPLPLEPGSCVVALWRYAPGNPLTVVAANPPGTARIVVDGRARALARLAEAGTPQAGQPPHVRYGDSELTLTLDLTIEPRPDLPDGARIPSGTLTVSASGRPDLIVPVAGLFGCSKPVPPQP